MKRLLSLFTLAAVLGLTAGVLPPAFAADPAPAAPAAPTEAAAPPVLAPTDLDKLRENRDKEITVEGTILRFGESKSKTVRYLNFTQGIDSGVALVFFVANQGENFTIEKLQAYVGKKVRATGKLDEYKERLQIVISKPEQLKIVPDAPAN